MSVAEEVDFSLFSLERATSVSALLDDFILDESKLGGSTTTEWVEVPMASFSYTHQYNPDENGTLIYGSETAVVTITDFVSSHHQYDQPLYSLDRIRASYDGEVLFLGTVDVVNIDFIANDNAAERRGHTHRVNFSATAVGTYASMLGKTFCYTFLPGETFTARINRVVDVIGWV